MWETSPKHALQPCAYPTANEEKRRPAEFIQGGCHAFGTWRGRVKSGSKDIDYSSHKPPCINEKYTSRVVRRRKTKNCENRVQQRWHTSFLKTWLKMETSRFNLRCDVTGAKGVDSVERGRREGRRRRKVGEGESGRWRDASAEDKGRRGSHDVVTLPSAPLPRPAAPPHVRCPTSHPRSLGR